MAGSRFPTSGFLTERWCEVDSPCKLCGALIGEHGFSPARADINEPCYQCAPGYWASLTDFAPVVMGVGKDAPVVVNAHGGKQSHSPYRCDLLPPLATLAVAGVLRHGAAKYGANNWHAIEVPEHLNHAITHVFAYLAGDGSDDHLEHAACRLLMALEQKLTGRPKPEGGAA